MFIASKPEYTQFPRRRLIQLLYPLLIEQLIIVGVSLIDAVMLTSVNEAAYSAISLVDMVNLLVMQIFMAIGAGGSIVAAQFVGKRDRRGALDTANQTAVLVLLVSVGLSLLTLVANRWLLGLMYPRISPVTMAYSVEYLALSAISYPFYAMFYCGSSLLYAQSNSRSSMFASMLMNGLKVGLNLLFIRGFGLGVLGIGLSTILSRATGAFVVTRMLLDKHAVIHYSRPFSLKLALQVDKRIFKVAGPSGIENILFLSGKLVVGTIFAGFSGAMIAANAASNTISALINVPAAAINLATITVVGQCVGAGLLDEAEYNAKRMMVLHYIAQTTMGGVLFLLAGPMVRMLGISEEATRISIDILRIYAVVSFLFEPPAFGLPNTLRAAGDTKYTMYAAIISMLLFRVGFSYLLVYGFGLELHGIWFAMYADWIARGALVVLRFRSGAWKKHSLV